MASPYPTTANAAADVLEGMLPDHPTGSTDNNALRLAIRFLRMAQPCCAKCKELLPRHEPGCPYAN